MTDRLEGIFPVLPTPFHADGSIDEAAMVRLVDFAARAGVPGVVFPGFASEVETLTADERTRLLEIVVRETRAGEASGTGTAAQSSNGLIVIAGATATTAEAAIAHGRAAQALGLRHIMVQPPKSLGDGTAPVTAFLQAIAGALPDMAIILQNAPAPRGADLSPQTIVEIARAIPQVAYVKEETLPAGPAISHVLAAGVPSLKGLIGGGGARYILDEYARGACAAMPALELADEHVALDAAWRDGHRQLARDIYVRTLPLLALQAVYRMRLTKYVLSHRGVLDNTVVRAPTPMLDDAACADIDLNLAELGLTKPGTAPVTLPAEPAPT